MTAVPDPAVSAGRASAVAPAEQPTARHATVNSTAGQGRAARVGAYVCLGAGVFVLLVAVLLPLVVYPRVAVLPADPQQQQTLVASDATVLVPDAKNPAGATEMKGVDVTVTNYVSQDPNVSAGKSVVWDIATQFSVAGHGMVNARVERVSLDPHTALPTNCCGDRVLTSLEDTSGKTLHHIGYITWPFNSQKHDYTVWDSNAGMPKTAKYMGEAVRDGVHTYEYQAVVPLRNIGTMDLPGGLFGSKAANVTAQAQYSDTSTFWIEPNSGDVVRLNDTVNQTYTYGGKTIVAFAASLKGIRNDADRHDKDLTAGRLLPWLRGRVVWVLIPIGLILLAAGVYLALGSARRRSA